MNLNDSLNKLQHQSKNENNFLTGFLTEIQNALTNLIKNSPSNNLLPDSIYVVRDINDEKLSIVNIEDGKESNIYIAFSKEQLEELHNKGISDNVYEMSKTDFYNLNLGSNLKISNNNCSIYYDEIKIENAEAAAKLEDMYFCLQEEKNATYSVLNVSDNKIYLTNTKEGGSFSIPKEAYPNLKKGDLVKNVNGKYILI